jgi:hypothetical protein
MHHGLTRDEFREVCWKHALEWMPPPTRISTARFLERCEKVGFVSKHVNGQGTVEYFATEALRGLFFDD